MAIRILTEEDKQELEGKIAQGGTDLTGYAKETWVREGYQPKGNYLTEIPEGYATEDFVEQSLERVNAGGLCVTVDYGTRIASHSPAEILEAVNAGKSVYLCVFSNGGTVALSLVGVETDSGKAVFCSTVYDGLVFGHRLGILQASVYADKSVTFANDGSVLSMCVPVVENTDVGKILAAADEGLKWVTPPEGGVLQVTVDPASNLASHNPAEILEAANAGKTVQLLYHQSEEGASVLPLFQAWQHEACFSATGYGGYDRGYYTRTQEAFVRSDRRVDFVNDGFFDSRCVPHFEPEDAGKYLAAGEDGLVWSAIPEGSNGKDGVSASHSWNGTVLTVTSAGGTSSADLKGEKGDKGDPGASGRDGVSPTVTVTDITGGHRVAVTDAKGTKTFDVMDGRDGESGSGGSSGVPVIDLRELGFPEVDGPGYFENVMFNQTTYNTLKTKIEYGVAAIKLYAGVGTCTLTCHSEIYEMTSATEHRAVCISSDGYKYVFMLGCGDGLYGASFSMYDK